MSSGIQRLSTTPFEPAIHLEQKKWKPEYTKLPDVNVGSPRIKLNKTNDNYIRRTVPSSTAQAAKRANGWTSDRKLRVQIIRTGICAMALIAIIGISSIDLPFAKDVTRGLKTALTFDVNVDKTLGKLKFVQEAFPDIREVFASAAVERFAVLPVDGKIVQSFGDNEFEGIKIKTRKYEDVRCPADGVVESISIGDETVLSIKHGEYTSIITFQGAAVSIERGAKLSQRETIGVVAGESEVTFEMRYMDAPVDPEACVMKENASADIADGGVVE